MQLVITQLQDIQVVATVAGLALFLIWESALPFFDFFRRRTARRGAHVLRNLVLGGINSAAIVLGFAALWLWAATWAESHGFGIMNWLRSEFALPLWAHTLGAILLLDAWTYVWHRLNHIVPFFWRFHRVHHADRMMDVSTASRFHIGEIILSSAFRVPLIALFGVYLPELLLYETLMFVVVQFHHANIGLGVGLDRSLRTFIVTPAMHKVHHSRLQPETDSNFSAFLSIWDRIGRTFRLRADPREIEFGLVEFDQDRYETLRGLLAMPAEPIEPSRSSE
jgi:sterol desaturase/sphingolipid hydroxylase (fatty acid hydroxylase superfamily)